MEMARSISGLIATRTDDNRIVLAAYSPGICMARSTRDTGFFRNGGQLMMCVIGKPENGISSVESFQ
jgi:hypothetical protein